MGYQVYEDHAASDRGVRRWAGYGVPAVCDMPDCEVEIDRGMGWRCEESTTYRYFAEGVEVTEEDDWDDEVEEDGPGCELHFCGEHLDHALHGNGVTPKPDTAEWEAFMLTDESWAQWREESPEQVASMRGRSVAAARTNERSKK